MLSSAYPDQTGIKPYPLQWGAADVTQRGPVVCSRLPSSIKRRNAIGAHSGSYSIYRALAIALGSLNPAHKPSYEHTEPPSSIKIAPQPGWSKIVSFDPWGHLVPAVWKKELDAGIDIPCPDGVTILRARVYHQLLRGNGEASSEQRGLSFRPTIELPERTARNAS